MLSVDEMVRAFVGRVVRTGSQSESWR